MRGPVLICSRKEDTLKNAVKELELLGIEAESMVCNIEKADDVHQVAKKASEMGTISTVFNSGGVSPSLALREQIYELPAEQLYRTNILGSINVVEAFLPYTVCNPIRRPKCLALCEKKSAHPWRVTRHL